MSELTVKLTSLVFLVKVFRFQIASCFLSETLVESLHWSASLNPLISSLSALSDKEDCSLRRTSKALKPENFLGSQFTERAQALLFNKSKLSGKSIELGRCIFTL